MVWKMTFGHQQMVMLQKWKQTQVHCLTVFLHSFQSMMEQLVQHTCLGQAKLHSWVLTQRMNQSGVTKYHVMTMMTQMIQTATVMVCLTHLMKCSLRFNSLHLQQNKNILKKTVLTVNSLLVQEVDLICTSVCFVMLTILS